MSKDVINVGGEERVVREDTAKAYRGVNWAFLSIGAFILIAAIVAIVMFLGASTDGKIETPAQTANTNSTAR
jgi:flagellar basal body-associated protein FliL